MLPNQKDTAHFHPPACLAGPELLPWDVGPGVAELQELLCAHGFKLWIDGDFGWKTEAAVKIYQRQQGLRVDGVVGRETWAALKSTVQSGSRVLRRGHTGADVFELQGLLQVDGHNVHRDGIFGPETESAVKSFQQEHHLKEDGIVVSVTWTLLQGRKIAAQKKPASPAWKPWFLFF